jgi:heat shock protein HtpX
MKRIALLIATNIGVLLVLSAVIHLFGLDQALSRQGFNVPSLLTVAAVVGFGGAFISLAISKWMAKMSMGVKVIQQPSNEAEHWLVEVVRRQAQAKGVGMPEVGIFDSPEPNAFATGARRDASLVAVSTGLLRGMSRSEVEAVLAHEMSHVANGDMVTLTLIQGVVNTFVFFLARVIGTLVDSALSSRSNDQRGGYGPGYFITVMVAQLVLGILASMIVMWFSRMREFRADYGSAQVVGKRPMIGALEALKAAHHPLPSQQFAAFGIASGKPPGGFARLFMSHPPLDERIAALQNAQLA